MSYKYKKYRSLLRRFLLNVYTVEGMFDGHPLRMLIADDGTTLDFIPKLAFSDGATVSKTGVVSALKAPNLIDSDADLVVVGANSLFTSRYAKKGFRIVPKWLRLFMPVKEDPYAWLSSFGRTTRSYFNRKIHKIEESGFQCEIVTDIKWLHRFYREMYKPYTLQRFSEDAVIYKLSVLEKFFTRGFLVMAKKHGEPVAGVIAYQEGDVLHLPFGGIAGGDVELVKEGAMFAIHYFLAQQAHSWGCSFIDFGRSRSFLSDGTLMYKLNWHPEAIPADDIVTVFAIATPGDTPQAQKFLEANPHFYMSGGKCNRSDE